MDGTGGCVECSSPPDSDVGQEQEEAAMPAAETRWTTHERDATEG